jgi:hypothetical protein
MGRGMVGKGMEDMTLVLFPCLTITLPPFFSLVSGRSPDSPFRRRPGQIRRVGRFAGTKPDCFFVWKLLHSAHEIDGHNLSRLRNRVVCG